MLKIFIPNNSKKVLVISKKVVPLHSLKQGKRIDSLAQLVEHSTFNAGVLGSSPKRITKRKPMLP